MRFTAATGSAAKARETRITAGAARKLPIKVRRETTKRRDVMTRSPPKQ
jgi:hypothetical protein